MTHFGPKAIAILVVLASAAAACGPSSGTPSPQVTTNAPGSPPVSPILASAAAQLPSSPTNFTATAQTEIVPCPSPNAGSTCSQTKLDWQSSAGPDTWFTIYEAYAGLATCDAEAAAAKVALKTDPGVVTALVLDLYRDASGYRPVGGGNPCFWITAGNAAGESVKVAATARSTSAAQLPAAPTNFTATVHSATVACPSPNTDATRCLQTDFAWQSSDGAADGFTFYIAWTGEGPQTCTDVQGEATVVLKANPGATSTPLFVGLSTGGGMACHWITATNSVGESAKVPAAGQ